MKKEKNRDASKRNIRRALLALLIFAAIGAVIIGYRVRGSSTSTPESFSITKFTIHGVEGVIDQGKRTIVVTLPYDTDVTALVPEVKFIGANIRPALGEPMNFRAPVKYTVFSKDGSAFPYFVTVTLGTSNTEERLSFELDGADADSTDIIDITEIIDIIDSDEETETYEGIEPYGTDVRNLVAIAPSTEANIIRFTINNKEGEIDRTNIAVTVPYGTNTAALTPVITVSGGASVSMASGTAQDFTYPVTYTVTAEDRTTTKTYTVTVTPAENGAKEITAFTIAGQEKSEINENTITITLLANMPRGNLTPMITFAGSTVSPASGVAQDFTYPVTYTVKAADNSTQAYTVTVIYAPATNITFNSVTANGASWTTETTALTLNFSEDMGEALKAEHITLTGNIDKGALTYKGAGVYELAVSGIPDNNVAVNVTVVESAVYGFAITGNPKSANVFKAPVEVSWGVAADGVNITADTKLLTFSFDKNVGLAADDITLSGAGVIKGTLSPSGTTQTLTVSGINENNVDILVDLNKPGFAFNPGNYLLKVYKKLNADADLNNLTVEGYNIEPAFSTSNTSYTVAVDSDVIQITATAHDTKSQTIYVENMNATVNSGQVFRSRTLNEGANTVTVTVIAEDGITTTSYVLNVTYTKEVDFPAGTKINKTFVVSNVYEWNSAVNNIAGEDGNSKNYIINVIGDFDVAGSSTTFSGFTGTVVIRGSQTIGLSSKGRFLSVGKDQNFILRDITLKGRTDNSEQVVKVEGGTFEMRGGAKITDNSTNECGGVGLSSGSFTMRDTASVSGNTASTYGGGVYLWGGSFTMRDNASVSGNSAYDGGGVYLKGGSFTMRDNAVVSGNKAEWSGGGVRVYTGNFIMRNNAFVSGNSAYWGGGVHISGAQSDFTMQDNAVVSGNTASYGGGVSPINNGTFRIAGGTVYGLNVADSLKNTATYDAALRKGAAEYGTFNADGTWVKNGDLDNTDDTIKVVNGVLQ